MDAIVFDRKKKEDLDNCISRVQSIMDKYMFEKEEEYMDNGYFKQLYHNQDLGSIGVIYRGNDSAKLSEKLKDIKRTNVHFRGLHKIRTDNLLLLDTEDNGELFKKIKEELK